MKRKSLFAFVILIMALCAGLGCLNLIDNHGMVTHAASSTSSVWDGSASTNDIDYYKDMANNSRYIYTAAGFKAFANEVNGGWTNANAKIYLETDIDLNKIEWTPIEKFNGTFYGQRHYIYNLTISTDGTYVGLFGEFKGRVENLNLRDVNITANGTYVGAIAGIAGNNIAEDVIINQCSVDGKISGQSTNVGGVIGAVRLTAKNSNNMYNCENTIKNLKSSVEITGISMATANVGGIVGLFLGNEIKHSAFDGKINTTATANIGGIVGLADKNGNAFRMQNVYSIGKLDSDANSTIGGLIGRSATGFTSNTINMSYNAGNLDSASAAFKGGIIGCVNSGDAYALSNVFNVGDVGGKNIVSYLGSSSTANLLYFNNVSATNTLMTIENVYCSGNPYTISATIRGTAVNIVNGLPTFAKTKGFYSAQGWDFGEDWMLANEINGGYPYLKVLEGYSSTNGDYNLSTKETNPTEQLDGNGTAASPYIIRTAGDLAFVSYSIANNTAPLERKTAYKSAYYSLQNDLNLIGRTWQPIGSSAQKFAGVFNGNGHTISGITTSMQSTFGAYGLFGYTNSAIIKNLIVKDVNYLTESSKTGAIIGKPASSSRLINCVYVDANGGHDYNAVGSVSGGTIYVYKGNLNFDSNYTNNKVNDLFDSLAENYTGYDVEIDANGGIFYKYDGTGEVSTKAENIITGEYHVLVSKSTKARVSIKDVFYQKYFIPQRYAGVKVGTASNFVINEGYKLSTFNYKNHNNVSYAKITSLQYFDDGDLTLIAQYEEKNVDVVLVYNQYEANNFGAILKTTPNTDNVKKVPYDSVLLSEWKEIFAQLPAEREEYALEGIYFDEDFTTLAHAGYGDVEEILDWDFRVTDDVHGYRLYAKWKGIEWTAGDERDFTITINLGKYHSSNNDIDYVAKRNFNVTDAVKSITLYTCSRYGAEEVIDATKTQTITNIQNANSFTLSNTLDSDAFEKYYRIEIEFEEGYRWADSDSAIQFGGKDYGTYGKLVFDKDVFSTEILPVDGNQSGENARKQFNAITFRNLYTDYNMTVNIQREKYEEKVYIEHGNSDKIYFAVAPNEKCVSDGELIINGYHYSRLNCITNDPGEIVRVSLANTYIGYDFKNEVIITSADALARYPFEPSGSRAVLSFNGKQYRYQLVTQGEEQIIVLYLVDEQDRVLDTIAKVYVPATQTGGNYQGEYKFEYFYGAGFVFLFSTEDGAVTFRRSLDGKIQTGEDSSHQPIYVDGFEGEMIVTNSGGGCAKEGMIFSDMKQISSGDRNAIKGVYAGTGDTIFAASTQRTQLVFNYRVVDSAEFEGNDLVLGQEIDGVLQNTINYAEEGSGHSFGFEFIPNVRYTFDENFTIYNLIQNEANIFVREILENNTYTYLPLSGTFNSNTMTLTINTDENMKVSDIVAGDGRTGEYEVIIVPKKVVYNVNVKIGKLENGSVQETDLFVGTNISKSPAIINYDTEITFSTQATYNNYVFVGWHDGSTFLKEENAGDPQNGYTYTIIYHDFIKYNPDADTMYAVYQPKEYTIDLYRSYVFDSENEDVDYHMTYTGELGIETEMSIQSTKVEFAELEGVNGYGFYVKGYKLFLIENGSPVEKSNEINEVPTWEFTGVHTYTEQHLKEDTDAVLLKQYLVLPVIARRTASLLFKAGADNVLPSHEDIEDDMYSGKFGDEIDISGVSNAFATRIGYTRGYLKSSFSSIDGETIYLDSAFFAHYEKDQMDEEVTFTYDWVPNTYIITFNENGGMYIGQGYPTLSVEFENSLQEDVPSDGFVRVGYSLDGWSFNGVKVIDINGAALNSEVFQDSKYIYANDITLNAIWKANKYNVAVYTNGANAYYKNGELVDEIADELTNVERYRIDYNSSFEAILNDYSGLKVPTRDGFVFSGVYFSSERATLSTQLTSSYILSVDMAGVDLTNEVVISLYVGWTFDDNNIYLPIQTDGSTTFVYSGEDFNISVGEYLTDEDAVGIEVSYVGGIFSVSTLPNTHTEAVILIDGVERTNIVVKDAGTYVYELKFTIQDGTSFLNLGNLLTNYYSLNVYIEKAQLNTESAIQTELLHLINVKKMVSPFLGATNSLTISECQTFANFINVFKQFDNSINELSNTEVYEYLMIKYYLVTMNDDISYRHWTHDDYVAYKQANSTRVSEILDMLTYFDYYIYGENAQKRDIAGYNGVFAVSSNDVSSQIIENEVVVAKYSLIASYADEIAPNINYSFRVYFTDLAAAANYQLSKDSYGYYIQLHDIHIIPQVYAVEDIDGSVQSYYNGNVLTTDIEWSTNRESYTYSDKEYYKVANGLYLSATLTTSNIGDAEHDTEYNFFDNTNTLYFTNQRAIFVKGNDVYVATNYFKFVLPESYSYTILNISTIAEIKFTAKYLSSDGSVTCRDIDFASELLSFSSLVYDLGQGERTLEISGREIKSPDGTILGEVRQNNNNEISILINDVVKKLVVTTKEGGSSIGSAAALKYIKLYKWSDAPVDSIDGTMEQDGRYELDTTSNNIDFTSTDPINYYAIYTDLVLVNYNLNFPESYTPQSVTNTVIKLGGATKDDWFTPYENGFVLADMRVDAFNISYESLFDENDVFIGLTNYSNSHAPITISVRWRVEDIQATQIFEGGTYKVGSFDMLFYNNIVDIENYNDRLFNYSYEWKYNNSAVSTTEMLTLENGGVASASGDYSLIVTATIKDEFIGAVDADGTSSSYNADFELNFMANKITRIDFTEEDEVTYSGSDRLQTWYMTIAYKAYIGDDYSTTETEAVAYYTPSGVISHTIKKNNIVVAQMRNAGVYSIETALDSDYYIIDENSEVDLTFTYTILPYVFELDDCDILFTKKFNETEKPLTLELHTGIEYITMSFTRESGEDVGLYDVYLSNLDEDSRENYKLTMSGDVVFENSAVVGNNIAVGSFEILQSGVLKLYYNTNASLSENFSVPYDEKGYTATITGDFKLKIYCGPTLYRTIDLLLFDVDKGETLSAGATYNILKAYSSDIQVNFYATEVVSKAENQSGYLYYLVNGNDILKYYSNVLFENGYQFIVTKKTIDITTLIVDKIYDGKDVQNFTFEGEKIDDVDEFDGVYVRATYADIHAASDIRVDFDIVATGAQEISNYELSANSTTATISKLTATYSAETTKVSYTYGEVSEENFATLLTNVSVEANNEDVTSLLMAGYYTLTYNLPTGTTANASGYIYAGNYAVTADSTFVDFNMSFNLPTLTIARKEINHNISQAMFRKIVTNVDIGPYVENYSVNETGDVLTLEYYVRGKSAGDSFDVGYYHIDLAQTTFANNSILIIVPQENNGLQVLPSTNVVYLRIDNTSILTQTYNGQAFVLSVDSAQSKLIITNGENSVSSDISFWEGSTRKYITDFTEELIYYADNQTSFTSAGEYKLTLRTNSNTYPNIMFESEYAFNVQRASIDVSVMDFSKEYDGDSGMTIDLAADVFIVVKFADAAVGNNKAATIYLNGANAANYILSATNVVGEITKAAATLSLTKAHYTYGQFTQTDKLNYVVEKGGETINASEYSVTLTITDAAYSSSWNYLDAGQYQLGLTYTSTNYQISLAMNTMLTIDAYELSVTFNESGKILARYGTPETQTNVFTMAYRTPLFEDITLNVVREAGTDIGYYKALSATSSNTNYFIDSDGVTDNTDGVYRILKSTEKIYLLLTDQATISDDEDEQVSFEFDGISYNNLSVEVDTNGGYQLVVSDGTNERGFHLSTYTYSNGIYTKVNADVQNLSAEINLNAETIRNVATYSYSVANALALNYEVSLTRYGKNYNYIEVTKKNVYFNDAVLEKVFDNKDATFTYEDANELTTGVVDGDSIGLEVEFHDGANIAKFVGTGYSVAAVLTGEVDDLANYNLVLKTAENINVSANITKAELIISMTDATYIYGSTIYTLPNTSTEVDLDGYDMSKIDVTLSIVAPQYSTSGNLKVGEYRIDITYNLEDFTAKVLYGGNVIASYNRNAKITITPRELTYQKAGETLENVFKKTYDGTTDCDITGLELVGVLESVAHAEDDVVLLNATYGSSGIGTTIPVTLTLDGDDAENYSVPVWQYGVIEPIIVNLAFDYNAGSAPVKSNVEARHMTHISRLAFPFVSTANISANSYDPETAYTDNFPTSLSGFVGHTFATWTLRFASVVEGSAKYNKFVSLANTYTLTYTYENEVFTFNVANKPGTAALLNYLIRDDAENYGGMYYVLNDNITITFVASWITSVYDVMIYIDDETGVSKPLGVISVNGTELTGNDIVSYEYNENVQIIATPNEHTSYYGFYDDFGRSYDGAGIEGISVSRSGSTYILEIEHITTSYVVHVRFREQRVTMVVDVTDATDASVGMEGFTRTANMYSLESKYLEMADYTFADLQITRLGYEVDSLVCAGNEVLAENFETAKLSDYITTSDDCIVLVVPSFVAVGVVVTLDYGYDDITRLISVSYNATYGSSAQWVETPEREGYNFIGWYDENDLPVTGETQMTKTEGHTLCAQWNIADFEFAFGMTNATISVDGTNVDSILRDITFGDTFTFEVVANQGYVLPSVANWAEELDVEIHSGVATVSITMPGRDVEINLNAVAGINNMTISGQRINNIVVYELGDSPREVEEVDGKYGVYTGNRVRVVLTAEFGYQFSNNVVVSDENIVVEKTKESDTMTLVLSNFTSDFAVATETEESTFDVEIEFSDVTKIDHIIVDSRRYVSLEDLSFSIMRGEDLEIFVMYNYGSAYDTYETEQGYQIEAEVVDVAGETYTQITIADVEEAGHVLIKSQLQKYTLTLRTISYNENREVVDNPNNVAVIFQKNSPYTADYGTVVILRHSRAAENYNFAGWSKDGTNIFNADVLYEHTITETETIYAIYSATKFVFTFGTYDLYSIYSEYQDPSKTQTIYHEISGLGEGFYEDENLTRNIERAEVFYGANKTIYFKVPTGYRYSGFGYMVGDNFQFLGGDDTSDESVPIAISTMDFDTETLAIKIYAVLRALSSKIDVKTQINIDGYIEENTMAGSAKLVSAIGNDVNIYGYIDGTRVHYTSSSFVSGELVNGKEFSVIAYTGESAYIQVIVEREGYKLYSVLVNDEQLTCIDQENNIYEISNIVGGNNIEVIVSFKPILNKIEIKFKTDVVVEAGSFTFETEDTRKVFASGTGYNKIEISAYTDSRFTLIAYIGMGYYVDPQNIEIIDESGLVNMESLQYHALIPTSTGFSAQVSFDVSNYFGSNEIYITVLPRKYTAKIYDDSSVLLAEIKNVEYDKQINLFEENSENIIVYDERFVFENGKLNLKITRANFNFEGYFSYQNGAGIRYINSDGLASSAWKETGYYYDTGSSRYKLTDNAHINEETGEMEISLYLYMSYNKTRISFEMVPAYVSNITAKDMIVGVDYTNSWFYEASPYYIEVAYNTPIKIIAPEIDGYKFYKFVFSQRDIHGDWLTDVVSYSGSIPWETNELDSIVECKIKMIYFALVTVVPYGGEGDFVLTQQGDDSQAQQLIEKNYVDTTKVFSLRSVPADGYEFVRWNNITSSRFSSDIEWDGIFISQKTTFVMNLQGKSVTLNFSKTGADGSEVPYDITYGQIINVSAVSINGRSTTTILGTYTGGTFNRIKNSADVRVGDTVTFTLAIDHGYGVVWNRDDIKYDSYVVDRYTFKMKITPEMEEEHAISVFPTFKNEIISVYINKDFAEDQKGLNAVDKDNVDFAGDVLYQNVRAKSFTIPRTGSITLSISENPRYKISEITLKNYDREFDVMENFNSGRLQISQGFISENEISGIIMINITYVRSLWENREIEGQFAGNGTKKDPYLISSATELALMMKLVNSGAQNEDGIYYYNASYLVTKDIELAKYFWTPIGTTEHAFNGRFNFGGHLITLIYLPFEYSQTSYNGLFGVVGADAEIIENNANVLWWCLAGGLGVGLVASAVSVVFYARKKKKMRQKMSVK